MADHNSAALGLAIGQSSQAASEVRATRRQALIADYRRRFTDTAYHALYHSGAAWLNRRSGGTVFCYHNVVPDALAGQVGDSWLHIGRSQFAEQIDWISRSLTVVPMDEMLSRLRQGRRVGGLAALTFDDGYAGVVRYAVPVMRAASLPFTIFPVTHGADQRRPFWWDLLGDLASEQREGFITSLQGDSTRIASERRPHAPVPEDILPASWDVLRSALGDDCAIGVHGVTHSNLAELPAEAVAWELTHARERIAEELGVVARLVAYPYGISNSVVQEETRRAGFGAGIGLDYALIRAGAPIMNLARVNVPVGLALPTFACWASGLRLRS